MPINTRAAGKRKRNEQQEAQPERGFESSPKAPRSRRAKKSSPAPPISDLQEDLGATLTRRRAQALGKHPTLAVDEPERYLQQKAREHAQQAKKDHPGRMERRTSSGGGPGMVSLIIIILTHTGPVYIF